MLKVSQKISIKPSMTPVIQQIKKYVNKDYRKLGIVRLEQKRYFFFCKKRK